MSDFNELFSRNIGTLDSEQQEQLQQSRVAVVGCGGLGGHVVEQLVRLGVGRIHCFDPDIFSLSNCNRQLNATRDTMGQKKATIAAARASAIHGFNTTIAYPDDFRNHLYSDALAVDLIVDCLDEIKARRELSVYCRKNSLTLVHGAVQGWYGQVGTQPPHSNLLDRLYPAHTVSSIIQSPSVLAPAVALVASLQANETIKILLGIPSPLVDSWLHIDLRDLEFNILK